MQAAVGEAGGAGHRVLLGDADVEDAVGVLLGEAVQSGGPQHRGGDADELRVAIGEFDDLVGDTLVQEGRGRLLDRLAGLGVDLPDGVELVGDIGDGRLEAVTLLGDDVHDQIRMAPMAHSAWTTADSRFWSIVV